MNKTIWLVTLFLSLVAITACKKLPTVTPGEDVSAELDISAVDIDFEYMTASSKIRFSNGQKDLSANASIRIKKDSIIWISVSPGFGVEAARGQATQDSLIIINRLDREYMAYDFKKLSEEFNFDITFDLLQAALLGNLPVDIDQEDKVRKENAYFVISQKSGDVTIENFINARIMKVEKVNMREKTKSSGRDNTLYLQYEDFKVLEDRVLPFINLISLNYRKGQNSQNTEINIEHKKADFPQESLKFPFNIPDKYEQK
jgi:hypothetical protein